MDKTSEAATEFQFAQLVLTLLEQTCREGETGGWVEEIGDIGVELGLLEKDCYDPDVHGLEEWENVIPGSFIYWKSGE